MKLKDLAQQLVEAEASYVVYGTGRREAFEAFQAVYPGGHACNWDELRAAAKAMLLADEEVTP